jgi:hypothetical protein
MKTKSVLTVAFLLGICVLAKSQTTVGGSNEASQVIDQKMLLADNTTPATNNFSDTDYISIVHQVSENKENNLLAYRFVGDTRYLILNPTEETLLYQLESQSAQGVTAMRYYFSKGARGEVKEITLKNVKSAFPNDQAFHEALDAEFTSDAEISSYELLPRLAAMFPVSE